MVWTRNMGTSNQAQNRVCKCSYCETDLTGCERYDFATRVGTWAIGCESCFKTHGLGLGIGRGQKFDAQGRCVAGNRTAGGKIPMRRA